MAEELVSGDGAVWIFPVHFFEIVGKMRHDAVLRDDLKPLAVPDLGTSLGTSYLEQLVNSMDEARTMLAANLEILGRGLVVAGTRTVDADIVEENVRSFWELSEGPWTRYESDEQLDELDDRQDAYYDALNDYTSDWGDD